MRTLKEPFLPLENLNAEVIQGGAGERARLLQSFQYADVNLRQRIVYWLSVSRPILTRWNGAVRKKRCLEEIRCFVPKQKVSKNVLLNFGNI